MLVPAAPFLIARRSREGVVGRCGFIPLIGRYSRSRALLTVMVQAAMASFKCPVLQNQALIPDPSDCRKYYHCLPGGRVFPMQCPNGLVFDTRQKVCIWDSTAKSCAPDTELPSLPQHQSSHTTKTPATKGGHSRPKASKMTAPDPPKNIISTARRNKDVQETQERRKPVLTTPATTHSSTPTSTTASTTSTTTATTTTETFSTEAKSTTSSKGAELEKQFSDAVDVINSLLSRVGPETASQAQHPASGEWSSALKAERELVSSEHEAGATATELSFPVWLSV